MDISVYRSCYRLILVTHSRPRYEIVVATQAPVAGLYVGQLAVSCSKELSSRR